MSYGIPYMGSKRKLAKRIIDYILENNPECEYIWDIFGGGGAISFEALQRKQIKEVFYNEINTGICELLKDITHNGFSDKYYQWIDRETFHANKDADTWLGGLCKAVWSFGNNQSAYLYGADIEGYKKLYHNAVVDRIDTTQEMADFCCQYVYNKYKIDMPLKLSMPEQNDIQGRRLEIRRQLTDYGRKCKTGQIKQLYYSEQLERLEQLQRLQQLEQLRRLEQLERLEQLQRLQQLERLEQLQQLQQLQQLHIINSSYLDVVINTPIDKTIIYLDPPYINTEGYQHLICYDTLYKWIDDSPYKIYLSSYKSPLLLCESWSHRSTLSATNNSKIVSENLYSNRPDNKQLTLFREVCNV
jgi:16S rRNA G966 N2-methylase RsmD